MQRLRNSVLKHVRLSCSTQLHGLNTCEKSLFWPSRYMSLASNNSGSEHIMTRVIELVKKFDKIDASKVILYHKQVTETADFQKDLCLDSLDRVELVMAFEQEFSVEIPDEKADKLSCCADVVKYILSEAQPNNVGSS
uniref:Acyl carrier protein n=1 Tax=Elaeis guineensis var. tenera TaxID=51953 RepID=A0A6I9QBV2_ELAGV|nr:acyl carrier protein 3, mitochondrial isoform X1 [Elaeis guineensis]XP_029117091.1 acyl carrier protein 3, mitochondrial isoform X1 [Elaeis guineensis]XP_029117092.1 acyl carrier protein 3, mitochondrial isoform X1 [Elaeis guineensis]